MVDVYFYADRLIGYIKISTKTYWVENSWILANIDYVGNLGIYTCYHIGDSHIADGRQYEDQQLGGYSYGHGKYKNMIK